jgi:hypothetical protein
MFRVARNRTIAVIAIALATAWGSSSRSAQAQVPYGPYSMTRAQFNQFAPVYYPRLPNYTMPWGYGMYPRYGYGFGSGFYRPAYSRRFVNGYGSGLYRPAYSRRFANRYGGFRYRGRR